MTAALKEELLRLKMGLPELQAEFRAAKHQLWWAEERIDRIETELRVIAATEQPGESQGEK